MTLRLTSITLVLVAGFALAQQPPKKETPKEPAKPTPGSLEDTLEKALRNSADIKAAEAKIREAEAEANRVRSQVLTRATSLHSNLNVARRMLAVAEKLHDQTKAGVERTIVPAGELLTAQVTLEKARGEVELLETELKSLRGEFAVKSYPLAGLAFLPDGLLSGSTIWDSTARIWDARTGKLLDIGVNSNISGSTTHATAVQSKMADRVQKFLDTEVAFQDVVDHIQGTELKMGVLISALQHATKADVAIHKLTSAAGLLCTIDHEVKGKMPVGAVLQAFEDQAPDVRIVVREYGLLVTTKDKIPEGAVRIADFWKAKEAKPKDEPSKK